MTTAPPTSSPAHARPDPHELEPVRARALEPAPTPDPRSLPTARTLLTRAWAANPWLSAIAIAHVGITVVALVGLAVDPRIITGQPAWMKPLKFGLSVTIYTATLAWLLTYLQHRPRWVRAISIATAVGFAVEIVAIVIQVARGTTSHFNFTTPLDAALFGAMGIFVLVIWLANLAAAALMLRRPFAEPAFAWGVRLGLIVALFGAILGFIMTSAESPAQREASRRGLASPTAGAHAVGVEDGGPGLPVLGWSTEGGDIRVAHFVGMHALQLLPLAGWWLARRRRRSAWLSSRHAGVLAIVLGLGYGGLTALLLWQALRAQPLLTPDALTLGALAALAAAVAASTVGTVMHARASITT
jgi:hypothetical protein